MHFHENVCISKDLYLALGNSLVLYFLNSSFSEQVYFSYLMCSVVGSIHRKYYLPFKLPYSVSSHKFPTTALYSGVVFWFIWHAYQIAYIIMIHDFITIWDHDLGCVGMCSVCVCSSWPDYWLQKLHILQVYHICSQLMHMKYLVTIMCTFWLAAILLKFLKWLSCLYC